MIAKFLLLCLLGILTLKSSGADAVVISEFMARNETGLTDEDGAFSDWIELHNPGSTPVNLDGWYLTDTTNSLTKWRIPATNILAGGYLLIFASGKDRATAGAPLHTSFNLSGGGEYLALVRRDGVTIASEYAPLFPEQFDDISYGIGQNATATKLIAAGARAKVLVPQDGLLGTNWTAIAFDDGAWQSGSIGIGFSGTNTGPSASGLYAYWPMREGRGTVASNLVAGGANATLAGGATWVTNDPIRGTVLSFNGTSAYAAAGRIPRLGLTTSNFTWSFWYKQLSVPNGVGVVLGNRSGGTQSPLQFIKFTPTRFEYYRAGVERLLPYSIPTGQWVHLAVVKNGSALNYYANGTTVGTNIAGGDIEGNPLYFGGDPGAAGEFANGLMDDVALWTRALSVAEITSLVSGATPLGFTPLIGTDISASMRGSNATAYVRIPFTVSDNDAFNVLRLKIKYDDGFIAYLNGAEVARRNAPAVATWNSSATAEHPDAQALLFEDIDLSSSVGLLDVGTNVLAVHGLNLGTNDPDFLILPELEAAQVLTTGVRYFGTPTPGRDNDPGFIGFVDDTRFSHDRGFYDAPFAVTITCETSGATIRYTTNGVAPTETTGSVYSGPITVSRTTTLRAAAYKAGHRPSNVDTHTYIFLDNVLNQTGAGFPTTWGGATADYRMDPRVVTNAAYASTIRDDLKSLPVVSIVMDPNQFFGPQGIYSMPTSQGAAFERPCSAELFFPDGEQDGFQIDCGIRISGGASRNPGLTPKHGVRLLFKTAYGASKLQHRFFENTDVDRFDSIVFRPNFNMSWVRTDNSGPLNNANADGAERTHAIYVRDQFTKDSYTAMGAAGAHERFVHLYINGLYWGLYNPCERTDASFAATYFGGEKEEYDAIFSDLSSVSRPVDGDKNAWNTMLALANAGVTSMTQYLNIQQWLDVTNLADYMMLNFYACTVDWPWQNWNALRKREPGAQFKFIVWDAEYTLETPPWVPIDRTTVGTAGNEGDSPARLYNQLRQNAEWRLLFADRAHRHFFNNGMLTTNQTIPRFLELVNTIDRAIVGESARWGDVVRTTQPYTRNVEWIAEKHRLLTNFFAGRTALVIQQLKNARLYPFLDAPSYNRHGAEFTNEFTLTISAPAGTIYYTTNGTDPRLPGGAVAPGALTYSGPVTLNSSRRVLARAFHTNAWSAINEAAFIEATPIPLRITEIMFNPSEPQTGTNVSEDFEFIELKNVGGAPLSLAGMRFTRGVAFGFTNAVLGPGQYGVLVKNRSAFESRYGTSLNVLGQYVGSLSDDGERIRLEGPLGERIHNFNYDQWYPQTDGLGFSLVPMNEGGTLGSWDEQAGWRVSGRLGGSPGASDVAANIPPVLINEVLTHTDLPQVDTIELYNPTASAIDVGGWFLTDEKRDPKKYRIPSGTMIAAGGYLLLDENQFGAGGGFNLSSRGEEIYLYSGDAATNLTGYAHGFEFGAAANGVSFGRHVTSTGEEHFPAQTSHSPAMTNTGPIVGPVVLTEIMYNPLPGEPEFVEIKNVSSNAVPLFSASFPSNTWRINGLNLDFPSGAILAPGEMAVVVSGNTNTFRSRYNVPAAVQIFGFSGSLQNDGESIELQRPDIPDGDLVPYITVDAVRYNDRLPWPLTADGIGPSLHKKSANVYGNDPIAWTAAAPTPGRDFAGGQAPSIAVQPASQTARAGTNITLSVTVGGDPPLSFQWRFNGEHIIGGTNASLALTNLQPANAGDYSVAVFSPAGATISSNAHLIVLTPPQITASPTNVTVRLATPGDTTNVAFRVVANGAGPLSYQWFREGSLIPNATNSILTLSNATSGLSGTYRVEVADTNGWASASALLAILVNPFIVEPPQTQEAVVGDPVTFRVIVLGTEPFGFRWRRNGLDLTTPRFIGAPFFTITNVSIAHEGGYEVIITNAASPTGVRTVPAADLRVLMDSDGDRVPDVWEAAHGFATNSVSDGGIDTDDDSMTNLEEYIAGTNPRDRTSYLKVNQPSVIGAASISFIARSNKTYTVQYNAAALPQGWVNLTNVLSRPTERIETVVDPSPAPGRYYRLVTPSQY